MTLLSEISHEATLLEIQNLVFILYLTIAPSYEFIYEFKKKKLLNVSTFLAKLLSR